ncbi:Ppx/GppA phosphatase family protein [Mesoterricola sediminis]|uniref:Exopolyphosphatase n=1 Tax=Mesoterricola sediminis TaxID=2927980 RepID=A0AA48HG02_9BACT|nr:Ppx/GppA phosphatase family protein [Mesoterricola sediminis]BDU77523.1 exopolyphosphatase [Mesoterricola sediminis]
MRIAAIDVGSNSIHLVVVETDALGNQRVLAREKHMVRLGRGLMKTGAIGPEAFQAGLESLALMAEVVRGLQCDTLLACGTAALREAANAQTFVREAARLGVPIRVISGEEEASLIYLAVSRAIPFPEVPSVLMDVGGGSTELTWLVAGRPEASVSIPWGIQRLADAVPTANPPTPADLVRVRKFLRKVVRKAQAGLPEDLPKTPVILATSGTLLDLAAGSGGQDTFDLDRLLAFKRRLWKTSSQARVAELGVDAKRAEVLHVGASWVACLMKWLGATQVRCLPVGLREGMVWQALARGGMALPVLGDRRRASVEALAAKLDPDPGHSRHVAYLADQLFTDLMPEFELGDPERELLGYAARLHDIGLSLSEKGHHKHGAYLITNAKLAGFWPAECEAIAQVVRYHRGKAPRMAHEAFAALKPWTRHVVEKLAAIVRVADALDRTRRQSVHQVRLDLSGDPVRLHLTGAGDLKPELESLKDKGRLLWRLLGREVEIVR